MTRGLPAGRRGGKRPGAGAPRGNLNALKHGLRSQQVRTLTLTLAQIPLFRRYLQRLARRRQRDTAATLALAAWLRHLNALHTPGARGPLPPPPPLTQRGVRLLARHLLNQTIKQKGPPPSAGGPQNALFRRTIKRSARCGSSRPSLLRPYAFAGCFAG